MTVDVGGIDGDSCGDLCVMVNPGKRWPAVSGEGMAGGMCCGLGQGC
jgi:hypothetical protein